MNKCPAENQKAGHLSPGARAKRVQRPGQGRRVDGSGAALADHTPASAELLRLMDATPILCGQSAVSADLLALHGQEARGQQRAAHTGEAGMNGEHVGGGQHADDTGLAGGLARVDPLDGARREPRTYEDGVQLAVGVLVRGVPGGARLS